MGNENEKELFPSSDSSGDDDDDEEEEKGETLSVDEAATAANREAPAEKEESSLDKCTETKPTLHVDKAEEKEEEKAIEQQLIQEISRLTIQEASPGLRALASWIQDGKCTKILVVSGAGVSVAAGIPDFRTKGTGLYDNLQKYNLPYPEAVFELNFYKRNPQPFVSLAQELWPGIKFNPTLTHSFISLLAEKGLLLRNYSQNIDGLEFLANIPAERLVECHGHFRTASCTQCHKAADADKVRDTIVKEGKAPVCESCGGFVKPDIVFFGEGLPERYHYLLQRDRVQADLVLVLGTSLQVAPVSMIPDLVSKHCKRALLNRELVGSFEFTCRKHKHGNKRDVFVQGDCDDSIQKLAQLLGWDADLERMHQNVKVESKS